MATLHPRITSYDDNLFRPCKSGLFQTTTDAQPWTSAWALYVSEFDLKLVHIPGSKNVLADALSRRPDLCPDEVDNKDVVGCKLLPFMVICISHHVYLV